MRYQQTVLAYTIYSVLITCEAYIYIIITLHLSEILFSFSFFKKNILHKLYMRIERNIFMERRIWTEMQCKWEIRQREWSWVAMHLPCNLTISISTHTYVHMYTVYTSYVSSLDQYYVIFIPMSCPSHKIRMYAATIFSSLKYHD